MIDVWYDRRTRSWVVQFKDTAGNQVGEAHYVATKREAIAIAKIKAEGK